MWCSNPQPSPTLVPAATPRCHIYLCIQENCSFFRILKTCFTWFLNKFCLMCIRDSELRFYFRNKYFFRGISRIIAASRMELLVTLVTAFNSILHAAGISLCFLLFSFSIHFICVICLLFDQIEVWFFKRS